MGLPGGSSDVAGLKGVPLSKCIGFTIGAPQLPTPFTRCYVAQVSLRGQRSLSCQHPSLSKLQRSLVEPAQSCQFGE